MEPRLVEAEQVGGSTWANYDGGVTGNPDGDRYDRYRRPIQVDRQLYHLIRVANGLGKSLPEVTLASLACGTGANEDQLLQLVEADLDHGRLGMVHMLDYSQAMTAHVQSKLSRRQTPFELRRQDIVSDSLPFTPGEVDVITMFQCVQHLDRNDPFFPRVRTAFEHAFQALHSGGALILIASTPEQGRLSRWYAHLCGDHFDRSRCPAIAHSSTWPPLDLVMRHLLGTGFVVDKYEPLPGPYIDTEVYLGDPKIVFDPDFQGAVSFFAMAKRMGVHDEYVALARALIESGGIEGIREESERFRKLNGVAYMVVAVKP